MTSALLLLLVVQVQAFNLPAFKAPLRRQPLRAAAEALVEPEELDEAVAWPSRTSPVGSLGKLYPIAGVASAAAYAACAFAALGTHPRLALPPIHTRLTIAQALVPLPLLWAATAALRDAAANGWDRLKSPTYRRLNVGLAFASAWLAVGVWRSPLFTGATTVVYAPKLKVAATAAHASAAFVATSAWAASVAVANPARKGWSSLWQHKSVLDGDVVVALSPFGALSRVLRGVGGSLATLAPSGALSDPDSAASESGALSYAALALLFSFWAAVSAAAPFPLATLPLMLGRRFSRAAGAFSVLAAVSAFCLKDAAERGRSDASTFVVLKRGLRATAAAHLLLQVAKLTFDSMDMYPAAHSRPLWTVLGLATYLLSLVA